MASARCENKLAGEFLLRPAEIGSRLNPSRIGLARRSFDSSRVILKQPFDRFVDGLFPLVWRGLDVSALCSPE